MPVPTIKFIPESIYHEYSHANGNENIFRNDIDYQVFIKKYAFYLNEVVETFAYCLMPNHFHFMVRIKTEKDLISTISEFKPETNLAQLNLSNIISKQLSHLLNSHTQCYNKRYKRKGSLFVPNLKRKQVETEDSMIRLIAYIHNNPVHHHFCNTPEEWIHSSIHAYLQNKPTKIRREYITALFGGKDQLIKFHMANASNHNLDPWRV